MTSQAPSSLAVPTSSTPPLRDLWNYAKGHRKRVWLAATFSLLNKACDVAPELLIGAAVDVVARGSDSFVAKVLGVEDKFSQLTILTIITVVIWLAESATEYVAVVTWRNLAQTIEHEARLDTYRHVQTLEMAYFEDRTSGGLMTVLNEDVNQLERFLDLGPHKLLITSANVVFVGVVFFVVSPLLAVLAFLPIPVIIAGSLWYQTRLEPRYARVREAGGEIGDTLTNSIGGMATIKAFTGEQREAERVSERSEAYRLANREAIRFSTAFNPLIRMAVLTGFTMTLLIGGRAALRGELELGVFSMLVYMTQRLLWPLVQLGETLDLYQRAMASCRRIFGLLSVEPSIVAGSTDLPLPVKGEVRFDNVHFSYSPDSPEVLKGLSITVPAGETHAIVGATGSGKSTVVKLLLRLYEPTSGTVSVDSHPLGSLTFTSLRQAMGFVAQDVFLFHGTVRENLVYGRPDATDEQVYKAAELAEASGFIEAMPDGYETLVGERGQKLSGGQRQRLTIARAILRDPAILVLDEATSAVDNETEAAIQRSMARVSEGRTTIVIAHRLSTVRHAHRIHVMEAGQVIESGTHDELVELGGLYSALWRVQTGESYGQSL
ncbi:MAG: ABC transporter ATP-binding protein [Acidimicrobiales bacterium]|nr:ABC transporter ATP-binding protein [Acidimicrobiales bacterium]